MFRHFIVLLTFLLDLLHNLELITLLWGRNWAGGEKSVFLDAWEI